MDSVPSHTVDDQARTPAVISTVHPDILQAHVLTRLDGPTLASAACACSELHALSSDDSLWRQICNNTWPSTSDPRVRHVISSFPSGHRSFYSDSFPSLHSSTNPTPSDHQLPLASELISAVDLHYRNKLVLSKVQTTETRTGWFMSSPFRVDLLDPKETVQTRVKVQQGDDTDTCLLSSLEKDMSLSWIIVDPSGTRAGSVTSLKPVSVTRHWLTGDLRVRFATILLGQGKDEYVQCAGVVTCGGKEGGELQVKEVSLVIEDMEGKNLSGRDSLVILQDAMHDGQRRKRTESSSGEERERYSEYSEMRRKRREKKQRRESRLDMVCVATVVTLLATTCSFLWFN